MKKTLDLFLKYTATSYITDYTYQRIKTLLADYDEKTVIEYLITYINVWSVISDFIKTYHFYITEEFGIYYLYHLHKLLTKSSSLPQLVEISFKMINDAESN